MRYGLNKVTTAHQVFSQAAHEVPTIELHPQSSTIEIKTMNSRDAFLSFNNGAHLKITITIEEVNIEKEMEACGRIP